MELCTQAIGWLCKPLLLPEAKPEIQASYHGEREVHNNKMDELGAD